RLRFDRLAVLVALEEPVAGGAEALPDRLRLVAAHRAYSLPVGLQLLDLFRGRAPRGGLRQLFAAGREGLLGAQVPGPLVLALRQVLVATLEVEIARLAEPLPDRLLVAARGGAYGLPFGLQRLYRLGRLDPVGGGSQRLGLLAQ